MKDDSKVRMCITCGRLLPIGEYYSWEYKGRTYYKRKCRDCYTEKMKRGGEGIAKGFRKCATCGKVLPLSSFGSRKNGYVDKICLDCRDTHTTTYSEARSVIGSERKRLKSEKGVGLPFYEEPVNLHEPDDQCFRMEYDGRKWVVYARLIYIGSDEVFRWCAIKDFISKDRAVVFMNKCEEMKVSVLKEMAESYRLVQKQK